MHDNRGKFLAALALLVSGASLRPAIVAASPLLPQIRRTTGLSPVAAGLLTTLPLVCFGVFAFAMPRLGRRLAQERLLCFALALMVGAICLRLAPGTAPLLLGTTIAGAAIAVANVVLPSLIKRNFPRKVALMSGYYALALSVGAAAGAGLTVPLEHALSIGWRPTLALWAIPGAIALGVVLPSIRASRDGARRDEARRDEARRDATSRPGAARTTGLWRDPTARAVALFMGAQSLEFYSTTAWLASSLQAHGLSASASGLVMAWGSIIALPACLGAPLLARRWTGGATVIASALLYAIALVGLAFDPVHLCYVWGGLIGIAQGSALAMALGFVGERAEAEHVAALSMVAQGTGYLLAAVGPVTIGAIHEATGGWRAPMLVLAVLLVPEMIAGVLAARDRTVMHAQTTYSTASGRVSEQALT